ncbi:MAG TPA: protein kinase [Pyrinomonadaceae bacterium]|nr:protein kinase [Pyrinomonadaceae bacterium]
MTPDNRQTEFDPESRQAAPAPTLPHVRALPEPTIPGPGARSYETSPTVPPVADASTSPDVGPQECAIGSLVVGRYLIERKLGQGGMGAVYLGRDRRLMDKRVVVKVLLGEYARDEWVMRKFRQEKEALTRANHPGIVGILDAGELSDGKPFLVMEYIDGVTLNAAISPGGMALGRAGDLVRQIGSALAAAHATGIYHRDLKPENIMLQSLSGGQEQVRIIDFGIAKVHDSLVADNTVAGRFGTYTYMSPEQFRVEEITAASDVYSMGAIAYEMVTGHAPFDPRSYTHIGNMYSDGVKVAPREHRRELPERAQKMILKALSQRPQDRFQNALEFGDNLAQALAQKRSLNTRPPSWRGVVKLLKGQARFMRLGVPAVIVVLAALVVVVAGSLIVPFFLSGPSKPAVKPTFVPRENAAPVANKHSLPLNSMTYWLEVIKARPGQAQQGPYQSLGDEIFETGDKFRLNVSAGSSGFLYVLNEGLTSDKSTSLTMIYPSGDKKSAQLDAAQPVLTGGTFAGAPGTEQFWMVWSTAPIAQLEAAKDAALRINDRGRITEHAVIRDVQQFLTNYPKEKSEIKKDATNHRILVSGTTDVLVNLLELKHQ